MKPSPSSELPSRREFVRVGTGLVAAALSAEDTPAAEPGEQPTNPVGSAGTLANRPPAQPLACAPHPLLTAADKFYDVSRGSPKPFSLTGQALEAARLTPETWRLEITADAFTGDGVKEPASLAKPRTLADGTALDLPQLMELAKEHRVRFLKAMQCLNIPEPLGQGLWEGVPLREVLRLVGPLRNVRRVYYWGFHNNDPKQIFQSSLSYTQAMETPPGELPAFLAYRLNGEAIPLKRGGPVRMVVPWTHGFKSIKWLHGIALTNDYRANDTYALQNNDPESSLKTAAYLDPAPATFASGQVVVMSGRVLSGWSGFTRVEYWLRALAPGAKAVEPDEQTYRAAVWTPCEVEAPPTDWSRVLPIGVSPKEVLGFHPQTGEPLTWPLRYTMVSWSATLKNLKPGRYEFRARAVDANGFAQPEPRPILKAGRNAIEVRRFEVTE